MDFFKNMSTQKLLIVCVVAAIGFNMLSEKSTDGFDQKVVKAIENNKDDVKKALGGSIAQAPPAAPKPAQPNPEEQFKKQLQDKVTVDIGDTPILGDKNAKIMIIVFSDFQCPFSKRGADTIKSLKTKYGNKLSFVHKNLPLGFHPQAVPAAKAALAAGKQGKFYEYHDKLYESQRSLGEDLYVQIAKDLGLNLSKFNADRNSQAIADQIEEDKTQAGKLGFRGTPGFTLNGVKILGAYPIDHFEKIITALNLS